MRARAFVIALLMLALPALGAAVEKNCVSVVVAPSDRPAAVSRDFDATEVADLDLTIVFPWKIAKDWRKEEHALRVGVINPRSHVYQNVEAKFVVEGKGKNGSLYVPGQSGPAEADWTLTGKDKSLTVTVRLPVAGSSIVQNSMYGEWSIEASVDGRELSCEGESSRFAIHD